MRLQVLYVPGLAHKHAIRPDLAWNLSNLMEMGGFAPLFPVFPVLPGPMRATLDSGVYPREHGVVGGPGPQAPAGEVQVLDELDRAARELGPDHPEMPDRIKAMDRVIGERVERGRAEGLETAVVSDSAVFAVAGSIPLDRALPPGTWRAEEQICHVSGAPIRNVEAIREREPGMTVLRSARDKALYGVDHPNCGEWVLVAPHSKRFATPDRPAARGTRGRLPWELQDYGVLICGKPFAAPRRGYVLAVEAAGIVKELSAK